MSEASEASEWQCPINVASEVIAEITKIFNEGGGDIERVSDVVSKALLRERNAQREADAKIVGALEWQELKRGFYRPIVQSKERTIFEAAEAIRATKEQEPSV